MTDLVLVTCRRWPDLSASDRLYANALESRGARVRAAPWNGPVEPFTTADAIVLRATWDYFEAPEAFSEWLGALAGYPGAIFNAPDLMRWNLDKQYLLDLATRGVSLPETWVVEPTADAVAEVVAAMGDEPVVIKPSIGQSGHHVTRADTGNVDEAITHAAGRPLIVQRFVPEVQESGEISCVFFDGAFSHAFLKRPAPGEYRVNSQYDGRDEPIAPSASTVEQAASVLRVLDETPLYARVDGVMRDDRFILMELELIEPGLGLRFDPHSADRFADATMRRLGR